MQRLEYKNFKKKKKMAWTYTGTSISETLKTVASDFCEKKMLLKILPKNCHGNADFIIPCFVAEFCPIFSRSRQCYKLFIDYILILHVKILISARRDTCFVLSGSHFPHVTVGWNLSRLDEMKFYHHLSWQSKAKLN